jgi:hypothetical protein
VLVFLGDEDDCSVCAGTTCGPLPGLQFNLDCSINRVNELTPVATLVNDISNLSAGDSGVLVSAIIGLDAMGNSMGPIVADPSGADGLVPICTEPLIGSAAPAPRIEGFTRSFALHEEFSICDSDYGAELASLGTYIGDAISVGCLDVAPCDGIVTADVTAAIDGVTLATTEYALVPAAECGGGFAVRVAGGVPVGSTLTIEYPAGPGACP